MEGYDSTNLLGCVLCVFVLSRNNIISGYSLNDNINIVPNLT